MYYRSSSIDFRLRISLQDLSSTYMYVVVANVGSLASSSAIPICRLWAEVFHVTTSSSGSVKWSQVSEDLVPVNISCVQPTLEGLAAAQQQQRQQQQVNLARTC